MTKKISKASLQVAALLQEMGYPAEFAETVSNYLNTDFTARQMLGYLRQGCPRGPEDIADEMLAILEGRSKLVERHIMAGTAKKKPAEELYIRSLSIDWSGEIADSYVAGIEALRELKTLEFHKNITFLVGENGSGKSTLLEALAIACGLNPEGGTANYRFSTYDDYSQLKDAVSLKRGAAWPKWSYFLRAESFYNVASALMTRYNDDGRMDDLHARSHGESFLDFIQKAEDPGLYLMDEPEAALSPQRQLTLLIYLAKMAKKGAQFIIVTHSPILLGLPDAEILSFDEGYVHPVEYEDTDSYQITKLFIENRKVMLDRLLKDL